MAAERHAVRHAIYLSFVMVCLASTSAAATKYASAHASAEAIVAMQFFICMLLCLPRLLRPGLSNLRTSRLGLHLLRGSVGVLGFYLFYSSLQLKNSNHPGITLSTLNHCHLPWSLYV